MVDDGWWWCGALNGVAFFPSNKTIVDELRPKKLFQTQFDAKAGPDSTCTHYTTHLLIPALFGNHELKHYVLLFFRENNVLTFFS